MAAKEPLKAEDARALYAAKFDKQMAAIDKEIEKAAKDGQHYVDLRDYGFAEADRNLHRTKWDEEPAAVAGMLERRGYDVKLLREGSQQYLRVGWGFE
jgi:hypothetical protein